MSSPIIDVDQTSQEQQEQQNKRTKSHEGSNSHIKCTETEIISDHDESKAMEGHHEDTQHDRAGMVLAWRPLLAECLGTFMIVFLGTGAVMSAVITESLQGLFQIAAVWIIAVTLAIACTASISGAHLNPAITISFALFREFQWKNVIPYITAQMLGSVLASWCNFMLYASQISAFEAANDILRSSSAGLATAKCFGEYYLHPVTTAQAFFAEALGTAILAAVIFALTHPGNDTMKHNVYIPPLIGMTVGGLISVLAPLTQAGFNPARDFGPRIVAALAGWSASVAFDQAWLYIVAPIVGAPIGAWLMDAVLYADQAPSHTAATSSDSN